MSWLVFKSGVKESWSWLKENWKIPFLIVWSIVIFLFSRRNTEALKEVIDTNEKAHRAEVEALNKIHDEEILEIKNLQKQYKETIAGLEKQFREQDKELSQKHVEDIKKIVIKSEGNPEEIKRKIENDFGIKFKN